MSHISSDTPYHRFGHVSTSMKKRQSVRGTSLSPTPRSTRLAVNAASQSGSPSGRFACGMPFVQVARHISLSHKLLCFLSLNRDKLLTPTNSV
ncbi:hypothetical protein CEK27_003736 [Fusarium fujikuroi]|uniref:Uncharacterized protein n=1 Tax=Fusarium fujikuroi TaxID=5127 RepID=A0A9Q9UET1_FUSFU|nr:hypothetical protein CEK27_003736 [Fusarium fujikuroi]QGI88737.1 hypothetical protein CEK25_003693 [Fusarium fujikuroi]VTT78829.1 unnamed protein product [Fusarium fujikuroi]VZH99197.1 unnamed protein product [Fusarium fujikuroi]